MQIIRRNKMYIIDKNVINWITKQSAEVSQKMPKELKELLAPG